MTAGPVGAYLRRLARELRQRGLDDARMVEEAREHLVDAVANGRERGLSVEEAEREAFERFGAAEIVAAHVLLAEDRMSKQFAGAVQAVWTRKWWILVPTVLTAIVTSVMSYYFLPTRYRSEATIRVMAARVPAEYVRTNTERVQERLQDIRQQVLSRPRLERMIGELGLYEAKRERAPMSEVVMQMRDDISVAFTTSEGAQSTEVGAFVVSFVAAEPKTAMQVTERLARLFIEENLRDRQVRADGTTQFISAQIEDVRRRLIEYEKQLEALSGQNGGRPLSKVHLLPFEVLQDQYKALLVQSEQSKMAANLERRQIGPQLRLLEPARLPERPVGPNRLGVNAAGGFLGLGLGIVAIAVRGRSKNTSLEG